MSTTSRNGLRVTLIVIFMVSVFFTVIGYVTHYNAEYANMVQGNMESFGFAMLKANMIIFVVITLMAEVDLFFSILYFTVKKEKNIKPFGACS